MGMSDYVGNMILSAIFRLGTFTPPTHMYIALLLKYPDPTDTGSTIVEPSGGAYARTQIDPSTLNWAAPNAKTLFSSADIAFPQASGANWGTIVGAAWVDASSGGNLWFFAELEPPTVINDGDPPLPFKKGQLEVMVDW